MTSSIPPDEPGSTNDSRGFDLDDLYRSLVIVRTEVPEDAFTSPVFGTQRRGTGMVIRPDGLTLTIGRLNTEAHHVWITTADGTEVPGRSVAYDYATGFGLVAPLSAMSLPVIEFGSSAAVAPGATVTAVSQEGGGVAITTGVVANCELAGYWEYLIAGSPVTSPTHPD